MKIIRGFVAEEAGQSLIEYTLLIAFVLIATVGVAVSYTQSTAGVAKAVNSDLAAAANAANGSSCRPESNCGSIQQSTLIHKIWSRVN
jgi:Flp pilus assembly pilin Flp